MYCNKCNLVGLSGKFCSFHGTELLPDTKECPHCNEEIWATAKFCKNCGRPVHAEK